MRPGPTIAALSLLALPFAVACSEKEVTVPCDCTDGGTGPRAWLAPDEPRSTLPTDGVRADVFTVSGVAAPPNPETGLATPPELNRTQVICYRADNESPREPVAVLIAYPGLLGGASYWRVLAQALVLRSVAAQRPIEVWAIDRRANLLEDLRGANLAEQLGDPSIAHDYYFGDDTIDGQPFAGFLAPEDVAYMSEWGMATHVEDLRRVIAAVPEQQRLGHLFLMGHSLGAALSEIYAAWRFEDGRRGVQDLAGIILIDGLLGETPISEEAYLSGAGSGVLSVPGLVDIRAGDSYFELPLVGVTAMARMDILALRAQFAPDVVEPDPARDELFAIFAQLSSDKLPQVTNAAAFGLAFDDQTSPLTFAAASMGHLVGGPVEHYENGLAGNIELQRPSDPSAIYDWDSGAIDELVELTSVDSVARSFVHGVTNFTEWYFPNRFFLDVRASGGGQLSEHGYQAAAGIRAFDGAAIDAPILAIAADFVDAEQYEAVRDRVAPMLGAGRRQAGSTRDSAEGFAVLDLPSYTHMDPMTAEDREANPVPGAVIDFLYRHVAEGTVTPSLW